MNRTRRHIFLIGFSGCGKSTIAPLLARRLSMRCEDSDQRIERYCRKSIAAIFEDDGVKHFRAVEKVIVSELASKQTPTVISLGGGAVTTPGCRKVIKSTGTAVYLRSSLRELHRRLSAHHDRPLLQPNGETRRQVMARLLKQRRPLYSAVADLTVSTTNKRPSEVVSEIIRRLGRS